MYETKLRFLRMRDIWCNEKHKSPIYFDFEQRSNAPLGVGPGKVMCLIKSRQL